MYDSDHEQSWQKRIDFMYRLWFTSKETINKKTGGNEK